MERDVRVELGVTRDAVAQVEALGKQFDSVRVKFGVPAAFPTGLVCFAPNGREQLSAVADILYGRKQATAKLNVRLA